MTLWFAVAVVWLTFACGAIAQAAPAAIPIGLRFVVTEANSPPGSCGCFFLRGAGVDAAIPVRHGFSVAVDLAGDTTKQVPATTRGLSVITLLAGPRYSLSIKRRVNLQAQILFGVARGFDADFIVGAQHTDTASVYAVASGGSVEIPIRRTVTLRPLQVEYLQTDLPNGIANRQRNLRLGAGIVFRVRLPRAR